MKRFISSLILILSVSVVFSEDKNSPYGGLIFPLDNQNIQLLSMDAVYKDQKFTVNYTLSNTLPDEQAVALVFPVFGQIVSESEDIQTFLADYLQLKCYLNGNKINFMFNEGDKIRNTDYAYTYTLVFLPNEKLSLSNIFFQDPIKMTDGPFYDEELIFSAKTSGWKGNTESAEVTFYIRKRSGGDYSLENRYFQFEDGELHQFYATATPVETGLYQTDDFYIFISALSNTKLNNNFDVEWGTSPSSFDSDFVFRLITAITEGKSEAFLTRQSEFYNLMQFEDIMKSWVLEMAQTENFDITDNSYHRFIINTIYALYGYEFQTTEWSDFFSQFDWYEGIYSSPNIPASLTSLVESLITESAGLASAEVETENNTSVSTRDSGSNETWFEKNKIWIFAVIAVNVILLIIFVLVIAVKNKKNYDDNRLHK